MIEPTVAPAAGPKPRARIGDGWRLGLELPPRQTVSQWADAKRMIAQGTGPEPGRWRTDRTPYLRDPMDAVCDPDTEIVVLKMSSQVGKTEVLVNVAGFYIDQDPAPQMLVLPTLELAESFSTKRFTPTVEASPALVDRIGRTQTRDAANTIREKQYPGGDITLPGNGGRVISIIVMLVGITLFIRLAQTLIRPHKVKFPCPTCGLQKHDPDAVHCKACGQILCIPDEGD